MITFGVLADCQSRMGDIAMPASKKDRNRVIQHRRRIEKAHNNRKKKSSAARTTANTSQGQDHNNGLFISCIKTNS